MRQEFEMNDTQFQKILDASKPVPLIIFNSACPYPLATQQENANYAWKELGEEMGFKYMTVEPSEKGPRFFTAEPK